MDIPRKDAANSQLYYEPYGAADFEKTAQDLELSQDVRDWPPAILQEFASAHAYAFQATAPEIEFEKIDEKTGCAFGAIILRKPYQVTGLGGPQERLEQEPEKVAVPIIVEGFRLKPFHIFIRGDKVMPLTETRFAEASGGSPIANGIDPYFQPSPMFMDKMMPTNVGYLGNMYGNYSMGGEGGWGAHGKGAQELFEPKLEKAAIWPFGKKDEDPFDDKHPDGINHPKNIDLINKLIEEHARKKYGIKAKNAFEEMTDEQLGEAHTHALNHPSFAHVIRHQSQSSHIYPVLSGVKTAGSADPSKEHTFIGTLKNTIQNMHYDDFRRQVGDERALSGFSVNKTLNIVKEILGVTPTSHDDYMDFIERAAPIHVVLLSKLSNGRWSATEANDYFFKPVVRELSAADVVARYTSVEPRVGSLMQQTDSVLLESSNRKHVKPIILEEHVPVAEEVKADGHYLVVAKSGGMIEGQIFSKILDYSGNAFPAKLFIGGSTYALQEEIVGERIGDVHEGLVNGSIEAGAEGTFVGEQDGVQTALLPFKVTNIGWHGGYMVAQAISHTNDHLSFVMMPGVTRFMNATGIADAALGSLVAGNVFFVPPSWHFLAFSKKVRLADDPSEVKDKLSKKVFFSPDRHLEPFTVETSSKGNSRSLRVIADQYGHYTLKGDILETLRYEDMSAQSMPVLEAHWVLTLLGVPLQECGRITALAVQRGEANVSNLRPAKDIVKKDQVMDKNVADLAAVFRRNLFKEASVIGDPKAADAMLSLNFVNETNLMQFMQNVPMFREVEEKLAELYLYACLGLKSQIPEQAILNAMKSLNEVGEHLDYLSAMMRMPNSAAQPQPAA
jgi:hypothetical protein